MSAYWELLKDPRWQRKRLEIMSAAEFSCEVCGEASKTLNVHHKFYIKGKSPWEYGDSALACLCEDCHESAHHLRQEINTALANLELANVEAVLGYALGRYLVEDVGRSVTLSSGEMVYGFSDAVGLTHPEASALMESGGIISGVKVLNYLEKKRADRSKAA